MTNKIYLTSFPVIVFFIIGSDMILQKEVDLFLLTLTGLFFLASIYIVDRFRHTGGISYLFPIFLLVLFHWTSRMNWCFVLYFLVFVKLFYDSESIRKSLAMAVGLTGLYTAIRFSYTAPSAYNVLVSFSDMLTAIIVASAIGFLKKVEREKSELTAEKSRFLTHDPLTGLLNYQEYQDRIEQLISDKKHFIHILIDCLNFKAMNEEQGLKVGNEALINIARFLKEAFRDAIMLARYQGDEFAVCVAYRPDMIKEISVLLEEVLPQHTRLRAQFSFAVFPDDAQTGDELVLIAENRQYQLKRQVWLKREEELFRTEKLKAIGELAAGLAHEIRNPLTTIKGFLQLAKNGGYNIKPWYDIIDGEVTRMTELTAEFLQFSKPHIANVKPHPIQDCIRRVLYLVESQALLLGHVIEFQDHSEPLYVEMDKEKIVQVLLNIVKNGFEAMNGHGTLRIRLRSCTNASVLEIEDNGKGIPKEELDRIFQPFYTTKENGTGLGLSICHKIILDHHGRLEVQSEPGVGTMFRITLPVQAPALAQPS